MPQSSNPLHNRTRASIESDQTIRLPKTAEVVADRIRKGIVTGGISAGSSLPPEPKLLEQFAISRPTLREALRILESEGLITLTRGSRVGATVNPPQIDAVTRHAGFVLQYHHTTIADVYDARLAIEPHVVHRLAERGQTRWVERLNSEIESLEALVNEARYEQFMVELAAFHRLLVELEGNQTLLLLTVILQNIVARHQVEVLALRNLPEDLQRKRARQGLRSFRKLVELIAAGASSEAKKHWQLHLKRTTDVWVDAATVNKIINVFDK